MADVLVVGAGPVGLTMAAELARHGVRPRIVDRLAAPLPYCRAIGVTPRTLEVYDDMGIARPMIDAGLWLEGVRIIGPDGSVRDVVPDFSDLPYGPLAVRQPETERVLAGHLASFGVAVERGVTLVGLMQDDDGVSVTLEHADGRREAARFAWVVGCDGAHSAVRKALGVAFEGEAMPMGFMLGEVAMRPAPPRGFAVRAVRPRENDAPDMFIAVPVAGRDRFRVSALAPMAAGAAEHGLSTESAGPDLAALQAVADRLMPEKVALSEMTWSSYFRISMRLAARYRVGRAFLAGDAAHIHPPTGGQGMNTGIQDAYNLAWKLALVVRGVAGEALAASYEAERRPVGADVVARTQAASMKLGREDGRESRLADTQILVGYRESPIVGAVGESDAASVGAGDRAPDATGLARAHVAHPIRLHDVLRGTAHVLLVWSDAADGSERARLEALAAGLAARHGDLVRVVAVAPAPAEAPVGVPLYVDAAGGFAAAYAPAAGAAWLVRPDGHVGLCARPWSETAIAAHLAGLLSI